MRAGSYPGPFAFPRRLLPDLNRGRLTAPPAALSPNVEAQARGGQRERPPSLRATGADVQWSDVCVRHVGYVDAAVRSRKLNRDLRLLKRDEQDRPGDPFTRFNLGCSYHELGDYRSA